MQLKNCFTAFVLFTFLASAAFAAQPAAPVSDLTAQDVLTLGGGKDEKRKASSKPSKSARKSAREARRAMRHKRKQIMARAKVRNFFHRMFNTKFGKPVNFRKKRQRRRWKKGRRP